MSALHTASTRRILIAGFFHETHTFVEGSTTIDDFIVRRESEILEVRGDCSPMGGVLDVASERGWQVVPAIDMRAGAGPIVEDSIIEEWWNAFEVVARREVGLGIDGIYLVLHGAMASRAYPDVEGEILRRLRGIAGLEETPLFGVTDLHANFSRDMARLSNALLTYRENPHTDARESGVRAAYLLDDCLRNGTCPVTAYEHPPIMWPPTGTGTADDPMRSLELLAREIEQEHRDILAVNVHAGYTFADMPETGVCFTANTIGSVEEARTQLQRLSNLAWEMKERGNVIDDSVEKVMAQIPREPSTPHLGPILLVEPSDNIGGGAPGDGTGILRALIQYDIQDAVVSIADAEAVEALASLQPGEKAVVSIGGKQSAMTPGPVELEVEVISRTDGVYHLEDTQSHLASFNGTRVEMGPSVVVRHRGIRILLTSLKAAPMDLGQLRSQGIIPEEAHVIGLKSGVAHRRVYDPIMRASYNLSTPGPCSSDPKIFPFKRLERPIYPLDDIE